MFLSSIFQPNWQGYVDQFIGASFNCYTDPTSDLSFHMYQSRFTKHASKYFDLVKINNVTLYTPYLSGLPINYLPKLTISPDNQIIFTHQ